MDGWIIKIKKISGLLLEELCFIYNKDMFRWQTFVIESIWRLNLNMRQLNDELFLAFRISTMGKNIMIML